VYYFCTVLIKSILEKITIYRGYSRNFTRIFLTLIIHMILQCIIFLLSEVFLMVLMQSPERWNEMSNVYSITSRASNTCKTCNTCKKKWENWKRISEIKVFLYFLIQSTATRIQVWWKRHIVRDNRRWHKYFTRQYLTALYKGSWNYLIRNFFHMRNKFLKTTF